MKKFLFVLTLGLIAFISFKELEAQTTPSKAVPAAQYYEGGQTAMYQFINAQLLYPPTAKRNRIQGECIVSGVLEADGTMTSISVVKNIGGGCGEEAARVVKLLKFNAPGFKTQTSIPVYFKL
ncbi:energy transducer TonB [uncultured Cytophaga sp.]|uniref:energy transducer TonB n=1 Tax=uncultured Cytophaga sp. TaxID=160238 RepID=UPI0026331AE5|nr:energy transducer TonB [uncultured Cytophaga sp.]